MKQQGRYENKAVWWYIPGANFSSVDESCNMDMSCRGGRGRVGGEREYHEKNTAVPMADVISGLVVWHFPTQQDTDTTGIKISHFDIQYKIIPNILRYSNNTKNKKHHKWHLDKLLPLVLLSYNCLYFC
jgi:hypothetical protein